jgi:hypothetical protein
VTRRPMSSGVMLMESRPRMSSTLDPVEPVRRVVRGTSWFA